MHHESSNRIFILVTILSKCHVTLQLPALFSTKLKQKPMKRIRIIVGFLHSSAASRAYIPSQCSFSLVWCYSSCLLILPFKMASVCELLCLPWLSWFASQQNLFTKSVQLLMVVISFIFLLPFIYIIPPKLTNSFFSIRFFFSHYDYSQPSHFVHSFNFSLFTKS